MVHFLIGVHAALGEIGAIGFLWILIELLNTKKRNINRLKTIALVATIFIFLSWTTGGVYYVNIYGSEVKPIIKEGPQPWAHAILMEVKEHVFLFLPFLALLAYSTIAKYEDKIFTSKLRTQLILLCLLIFILAFAIGAMGYLISSSARAALEAKIT